MRFILSLFLYSLLVIFIVCYTYIFSEGLYLPSMGVMDVEYDPRFFEKEYSEYKQSFIKTFFNMWYSDSSLEALVSIRGSKCGILQLPYCGFHFLTCYSFPGGYKGAGCLSNIYFGHVTNFLGKVNHLMTFHGCPIYDVKGTPFVLMPVEEYIMFHHYYMESSGIHSNSDICRSVCDVSYSLSVISSIISSLDSFVVISLFSIFCLCIYAYFFRASFYLKLLIQAFFSLCACCFLGYTYFLVLNYHSPDLYNPSIYIYEANVLYDLAHLEHLLPKCTEIHSLYNQLSLYHNSLNVLKYPINGHRYVVSSKGVFSSLSAREGLFGDLENISNLVCVDGFPLHYKWGHLYVQVPLDYVHSMDLFLGKHISSQRTILNYLYKLCSYYFFFMFKT